MKYQEIRETVLAAIKQSNALGLIHGTSGNISMRDPKENVVAITPSGRDYDTMKAEDITIVDLNGNVVDGDYIPSSETPMHTAVYRARKDVNAVVHTHSLYATVMSMRLKDLDRATVPSNMYYPIHTAPFAMPGSEELAEKRSRSTGRAGRCYITSESRTSCYRSNYGCSNDMCDLHRRGCAGGILCSSNQYAGR